MGGHEGVVSSDDVTDLTELICALLDALHVALEDRVLLQFLLVAVSFGDELFDFTLQSADGNGALLELATTSWLCLEARSCLLGVS